MAIECEFQMIRNTVSNDQDLVRLYLPIYTFFSKHFFSGDLIDLINSLEDDEKSNYDCLRRLHRNHDRVCLHFKLAIHEVSAKKKREKLGEDCAELTIKSWRFILRSIFQDLRHMLTSIKFSFCVDFFAMYQFKKTFLTYNL